VADVDEDIPSFICQIIPKDDEDVWTESRKSIWMPSSSSPLLNLSDDIAEDRVEVGRRRRELGDRHDEDRCIPLRRNYQDSISKLNRISSVARVVW
jgi:hypothetical protein